MLNQFAAEIPTLPVDQCISTSSNSTRNAKPFFWSADPQRRVAKHLGHTWFIGKRFCKSSSVFFSTLSTRIASMDSSLEEPLHSSTVEQSEVQKEQDLKCQSAPSAKDSVILSGGDSSMNYGADQQRLHAMDQRSGNGLFSG